MHAMSAPSAVSAARVLLVDAATRLRSVIPTPPESAATASPAPQLDGRATGRNRFEHLRRTYD